MWLLPGLPEGRVWRRHHRPRSNGPQATVYGVHGATTVVLLAAAALLFT
jgi:hypothetical protein